MMILKTEIKGRMTIQFFLDRYDNLSEIDYYSYTYYVPIG